MIFWLFAAATLGAAAFAAFDRDIRRAALATWVAGLGSGAVCMSLGAEALAILQWVVSTLVAISFVFFVAMFGEPKAPPAEASGLSSRHVPLMRASWAAGAALSGLAFLAMIVIGARNLSAVRKAAEGPSAPLNLAGLGRMLTIDHVLALEVIALTLLFAIVGGGILARPEGRADTGAKSEEERAR